MMATIKKKETALDRVAKNGGTLSNCSDELKADREVVLLAVKNNGTALCWANELFKFDKEICLIAVANNGYAYNYISPEFQALREFVEPAVANIGYMLEDVPEIYKNDREIVLSAIASCDYALKFASTEICNDHQIALSAVEKCWFEYYYISPELKQDKEIIIAAVNNYLNEDKQERRWSSNPDDITVKVLYQDWLHDYDVVTSLCHVIELALLNDEFRNNRSLVEKYIIADYINLADVGDSLKNDQELALMAINNEHYAAHYCSQELKNNREFAKKAIQIDGGSLLSVNKKFRSDLELVILAVSQNGYLINSLPKHMKFKTEVLRAALYSKNARKVIYDYENYYRHDYELEDEYLRVKSIYDALAEDRPNILNSQIVKNITPAEYNINSRYHNHFSPPAKIRFRILSIADYRHGSTTLEDNMVLIKSNIVYKPEQFTQYLNIHQTKNQWHFLKFSLSKNELTQHLQVGQEIEICLADYEKAYLSNSRNYYDKQIRFNLVNQINIYSENEILSKQPPLNELLWTNVVGMTNYDADEKAFITRVLGLSLVKFTQEENQAEDQRLESIRLEQERIEAEKQAKVITPEKCQQIVEMRDIQKLSWDKIGKHFNIADTTVQRHYKKTKLQENSNSKVI
ncbi:MAG: DUF4116 domain-containing protein [Burkholderiales bacterium]|nr:DUF4116 domain-containing protein [Burkholderiales bacterium]